MAKRYVIEKLTDILEIPEDRLDDFFIDLKSYHQMSSPLKDLIKETAKVGGIDVDVLPIRMTWIDDGKHDVTIKLGTEPNNAERSV